MSVYGLEDGRIAVLIPCYNEAITIEKVVNDFRRELPSAEIYVYDNNSSDRTAELAERAGAEVRFEKPRQGFRPAVDVRANRRRCTTYSLMGTTLTQRTVFTVVACALMEGRADMTVGSRLTEFEDKSFRRLHVFGNQLVIRCINLIFGSKVKDVMSGYRGFTARVLQDDSNRLEGIRDRDGADAPGALQEHGHSRDSNSLRRTARRVGFEIEHVPGWFPSSP